MFRFIVIIFTLIFLSVSCVNTNEVLVDDSIRVMDKTIENIEENFDQMSRQHKEELRFGYERININTKVKLSLIKQKVFKDPNEKVEAITSIHDTKQEQTRQLGEKISAFDSFVNASKKNFEDYRKTSRSVKDYLHVLESSPKNILKD